MWRPQYRWEDGERAVLALWAARVREGRCTRYGAATRLHETCMAHRSQEAIQKALACEFGD